MAQVNLNYGSAAGDGTGDILFDIFGDIETNFTDLYTVSLNSSGSVDGTDQLFTGHIAVGEDASVNTQGIFVVAGNVEAVGIGATVAAASYTIDVTGGILSTIAVGMRYNLLIDDVGAFSSGTGVSTSLTLGASQSANISNLIAYSGNLSSLSPTSNITAASVFKANPGAIGSGGAINSYGLNVLNLGQGNVVNTYGAYIKKQSGSTNNYGIVLDGDDKGADIVFGAGQDVSMHYDGTNMTLEGTGITAVASTATINNTIPIDINGTVYHIMLSTTA